MEEKKKIKNKIEKQNEKKYNFKNLVKSYKEFYIKNLKKKHIIIFIIMLIIFFAMLSFFVSNAASLQSEMSNMQIVEKSFLDKIIKEKIPLLAIIIFAGITPLFFLSVMGIMGSYTLAFEVAYTYMLKRSILLVVVGSLGSIIQIVAISLSVATGIYYCILSTKKFRYSQHMSFGFKDVKKGFYEIKKDEKKLKELHEIETKKAEKREKLNVKIPYINFLISFIISTIIIALGAIISNIM